MNVLFTSIGRRVELVRAFRRAYQDLGLEGSLLGVDCDPLAPALREVDQAQIVPRINSPDYVPTLADLCGRQEVDLIFPLIDPDILVLARHERLFRSVGSRPVVVPEPAARLAADKRRCAKFLESLGLRVPRTWSRQELQSEKLPYPLFIKKNNGSAGLHCFKVSSRRELDFFLRYVPNPLVQEFLPGPEITTDVMCDLEGNLLGTVSRQRIEVRSGEVAKGVTVFHPLIHDACRKIAAGLHAIGPLTVQCIMKNDVPYFTEINARFGGGVPLGICAGMEGPRWLLARASGVQIEIPPPGSYKTGLYLTRFDESFFIDGSEYETDLRGHLRPG